MNELKIIIMVYIIITLVFAIDRGLKLDPWRVGVGAWFWDDLFISQ